MSILCRFGMAWEVSLPFDDVLLANLAAGAACFRFLRVEGEGVEHVEVANFRGKSL